MTGIQESSRSFFASPIFPEDQEKTRAAYFINVLALSNIPILLLFIIIRTATGAELFGTENIILLSIILVLILVWGLMKSGRVRVAAYLHVMTIWLASTMIALGGSGVRGTGFTSYFVVMLIAGLLLDWRAAIGITALSALTGFGLAYAENIGIINYTPGPSMGVAIEGTVLLAFGGIFLILIINSLQNAVKKEQVRADELRQSNEQLTGLRDALEIRVAERTKELEKQQANVERRSRQFEAITRVTQAISATRNLSEALPQIANVISEQFGFYHVGIFLNDQTNQYAVLSAANSEGGRRMLARGHQLKIGTQGIVGYTIGTAQPRIALDTGADAVYFNNPDLPETRSEMALPLRNESGVIGALDVQSTERNAFSNEDIEVLTTLANQASLAIENAQIFDRSQRALAESESITHQYLQQNWKKLSEDLKFIGYRYTLAGTQVITSEEGSNDVAPLELSDRKEVSVPIDLRGETIGNLTVYVPKEERVNRDMLDLIKAVAERIAFSAENARLFEETSRRAEREQIISDIAAQIGTSVRTESILRTTATALSQLLDDAEIFIDLQAMNKNGKDAERKLGIPDDGSPRSAHDR
ncbi:MAG: GAF domain-containing protein [Chloroflexi bacterium]|nr:GAF domain-containing protein [Chloroflexota bacterium]